MLRCSPPMSALLLTAGLSPALLLDDADVIGMFISDRPSVMVPSPNDVTEKSRSRLPSDIDAGPDGLPGGQSLSDIPFSLLITLFWPRPLWVEPPERFSRLPPTSKLDWRSRFE